mmetsp:Transcript_3514/g.7624  ORF Transcript_3514/g.7624 Transcript_3514/m.7624 type:complete len:113 (+) Transcript_3514:131-469(+)
MKEKQVGRIGGDTCSHGQKQERLTKHVRRLCIGRHHVECQLEVIGLERSCAMQECALVSHEILVGAVLDHIALQRAGPQEVQFVPPLHRHLREADELFTAGQAPCLSTHRGQ